MMTGFILIYLTPGQHLFSSHAMHLSQRYNAFYARYNALHVCLKLSCKSTICIVVPKKPRKKLLILNKEINFFNFRKFAQSIPRKFGVRYDAYTQSISIIDSKQQIETLVNNVNQEVAILMDALRKLHH